jgi:hypothetical protein
MAARIPKSKKVIPIIPDGWTSYRGKADWKIVVGAKFWSKTEQRWCKANFWGSHALPKCLLIIPKSGLAFWVRRFMSRFL